MQCPECQHENPAGAKFYHQCATPLTSPNSQEAERRQLTVRFCDLAVSTGPAGQLDPEDWRDVIRAYQSACVTVIYRFEGYIPQYLGDGILVYFSYPQAHEDNAQRDQIFRGRDRRLRVPLYGDGRKWWPLQFPYSVTPPPGRLLLVPGAIPPIVGQLSGTFRITDSKSARIPIGYEPLCSRYRSSVAIPRWVSIGTSSAAE